MIAKRFVLAACRWTLLIFLAAVAVTVVRGTLLIAAYDARPQRESAVLYDLENQEVAAIGRRKGDFVPFRQLPRHFVDGVVAVEDRRFWRHRGVDLMGIARAVIANLRTGERSQGASTLTQQLAKNLFLSNEKTFTRKAQEAVFALLLEVRYTKREIFEMYVNEVYYGEGAYGIAEAARTYFGKRPSELDLAESAMLVALLRAPGAYSPHLNPDLALERRAIVLAAMEQQGHITQDERNEAQVSPLRLTPQRGGRAPYFVDVVHRWLAERFGSHMLQSAGLKVWTTLDPAAQTAAETALGDAQGAIVALDPSSGAIVALVGGRNYAESQFNRATQAVRQPGSAFKPFVFAAALERGWRMNDIVEDIPRDFGGYAPRNDQNEYWGPVTVKHALVESLNSGSVWLLRQIGVDAAMEMARRLGITTLTAEDRNLALALGGLTKGVIPLELAKAYLPFANGGLSYEPHAVLEVRDADGGLLYRHTDEARRVLSREVAYFMTDMLLDAVARGTGKAAGIGRPQAGKTGTTDGLVNAWFVGYTPDLLAAVYLGNDDGTPLAGGGGALAAPVWGRFMAEALRDKPVTAFAVPGNIRTGYPIDIFTGLWAGDACPYREYDSFIWGEEPTMPSPCIGHGPIAGF